MLVIELPWPDAVLNPNVKRHWAVKSKAAKKARMAGYLAAKAVLGHRTYTHDGGKIPMRIEFFPPDKRGRDLDNLVSAVKANRDGIADALGVNDKLFSPMTVVMGSVVKHGLVLVSLG